MTHCIASDTSGEFTWLYGNQPPETQSPSLLITRLCKEMRDCVLSPRKTPRAPLSAMRAELKELMKRAEKANKLLAAPRGDVFSSLDPHSIAELKAGARIHIPDVIWNQIAPYVTPEIVDAYCARGNKVHHLPYLTAGHDPVPVETAYRLIDNWTDRNPTYITRFLMAAADGRCPPALALYAIRHWLARWSLPRIYSGSTATYWLVMHVVAAHDGHAIEPWSVPERDDLNKVLTMTFSAHGRLLLHQRLSSLEELLQNPEETLASLAV